MSLALIRSHTETAGAHVGDLLWWTLGDARISRARLAAVWAHAGLAASLLPEPTTPEKALKTAVREAQVGKRDHLVRLGLETPDSLVFAVMEEHRDGAGNVLHHQIARIDLDRHSAYVRTDHPNHELVSAVLHGYEELRETHTPDDIRRMLVRTLETCAAITLRDHGGVYWVPGPYADVLRKMQAAIANIGRSRIDIVPIHQTPEGTAALGAAAQESLEAELQQLRSEIEGFLAEPPERASTLVRRLEAFEQLRQKAQLYRSILSIQVSDLETSLTELSTNVSSLLAAKAS